MSKEKWTVEKAKKKANQLTEAKGKTVYPLAFQTEKYNELIVGFYTEPARIVKMRAFDKATVSQMTAGSELLEACLLKEDSDPRIYSESPEHDIIYMGACLEILRGIQVAVNQVKKN